MIKKKKISTYYVMTLVYLHWICSNVYTVLGLIQVSFCFQFFFTYLDLWNMIKKNQILYNTYSIWNFTGITISSLYFTISWETGISFAHRLAKYLVKYCIVCSTSELFIKSLHFHVFPSILRKYLKILYVIVLISPLIPHFNQKFIFLR